MPHAPAHHEPTRVLVVDDVLMHRELAGAMLRGAGYEYTCVKAAAEAVAAVETGEFNVVLMDVRMPVMDGLEATRQIRALEGPRGQVPIVAMTAQDFPEQLAKCRTAGMDSYLAKPFDEGSLYAAVGAACSTSQDATSSTEKWLASIPPVPVLGSDLPILDPTVPERTAALLEPLAFKTLKNQCWAVLRGAAHLGLLTASFGCASPGRAHACRLCRHVRLRTTRFRCSSF